jgi:hypothetical protein
MIDKLPEDIIGYTCKYIQLKDILHLQTVSKKFSKVHKYQTYFQQTKHEYNKANFTLQLKKKVFEKQLIQNIIDSKDIQNVKKYIYFISEKQNYVEILIDSYKIKIHIDEPYYHKIILQSHINIISNIFGKCLNKQCYNNWFNIGRHSTTFEFSIGFSIYPL